MFFQFLETLDQVAFIDGDSVVISAGYPAQCLHIFETSEDDDLPFLLHECPNDVLVIKHSLWLFTESLEQLEALMAVEGVRKDLR